MYVLVVCGKVPAGYTAYLVSWNSHAIGNTMDLRVRAKVNTFDRSLSTVYHFLDNDYLPANTDSHSDLAFQKLPALCRWKVSVFAGATAANTNRCDATLIIALIAN